MLKILNGTDGICDYACEVTLMAKLLGLSEIMLGGTVYF